MKNKKKHKWKYQINIRKKVLVLVVLGVFLFVGLGYAILEANLGIGGTLEVSKYKKTLYDALKKEANNGYAVKYNESHQDSIDLSKTTEDIYYFYAANAQKGTDILDKNNVVFADKCWQMIRTTDTGGVKLLYNGDPETTIVDGVTHYNCGDARNYYHEGGILSEYSLSGTKIYAKNYTVSTSGTTTTFTLVDDPNDSNDTYTTTIDSSNADTEIPYIVENYPYTCGSNTLTCTNDRFYKVVGQSSGVTANVYKSTQRDNIGISAYNPNSDSLTYIGYKYGDVYTNKNDLVGSAVQSFATQTQTLIDFDYTMFYPVSNYKYSKTLNSTGTSSVYELNNPISYSQIPEENAVGYYTYNSAEVSGTRPYYLVGEYGYTGSNYYYYVRLSSTKTLADFSIQVGTDLVDNGDNTYTVKNGTNQATEVPPIDWFNNYASYVGKYTCEDASDTCQNPRIITASTETNYTYINPNEEITIAKSRNNLVLSDYITVRKDEWYNDYTTYGDYKYTCGDTSTTCTDANLKYISSYTSTSYTYSPNHYYGKSVKYENGVYKLQDIEGLETAANFNTFATHHYTCVDFGAKECAQVAYVYNYSPGASGGNMYYITLNDSNIESVQDVYDGMLKKNTNDSIIKTNIDKWYENNLLNTSYESKLDDTIYCNDRSLSTISGYTFAESGWNENGGNVRLRLIFKENAIYLENRKDLSCTNEEDRFSVSNNKAQLTYKIGLIRFAEMVLLNNYNARKNAGNYWVSSPSTLLGKDSAFQIVSANGSLGSGIYANSNAGVRPVISLVKGTSYSSGNGSMDNPYVVDMSE